MLVPGGIVALGHMEAIRFISVRFGHGYGYGLSFAIAIGIALTFA